MLSRLINCCAGIAALVLAFQAVSVQADDGIASRLAPVGKVCIEGTECDAAKGIAAPVGGATVVVAARSGEDVYGGACSGCHAVGAAGSPKFGDVAAWAPRIGKGLETLYANAINGYNAMPAKGLCMDCSDDEIKAAVDYMANSSK